MPIDIETQLRAYGEAVEKSIGQPMRPVTSSKPEPAERDRTGLRVLVAAVIVAAIGVGALTLTLRSSHESVDKLTTSPFDTQSTAAGVDRWRDSYPDNTPTVMTASPLEGRADAAIAWDGHELLVWGGSVPNSGSDGDRPLADGAAYDPTTRSWTVLPAAPIVARSNAAAVWTGTELLIWGGSDNGTSLTDGAAYDPARSSWRVLPGTTLASTIRPTTVWTGAEMIVLEGINGTTRGAAYNPSTNSWRTTATPPGRSVTPTPQGIWTGSLFITELGVGSDDQPALAAYDPAADTWTMISGWPINSAARPVLAWTGTELLAFGASATASGAWNPTTNTWRALTGPDMAARVPSVTPVWTGTSAVFWSGGNTAAIYNPASNSWLATDAGPLTQRLESTAVWADGLLLSWGGYIRDANNTLHVAGDGIAWRPPNVENTDQGASTTNIPTALDPTLSIAGASADVESSAVTSPSGPDTITPHVSPTDNTPIDSPAAADTACIGSNLSAQAGGTDGAMGTVRLDISITNRGPTCTLPPTPPLLAGIDPDGKAIPLPPLLGPDALNQPAALSTLLATGNTAVVWIWSSDGCDPSPPQTWSQMLLVFPDGTSVSFTTQFDTRCGINSITQFGSA